MDSAIAKAVGDAARAARKSRGLTQADIAEQVGISTEFYARMERGGTLPSVPTLIRLADTLGVPTDRLLGRLPTHATAGESRPVYTKKHTESPEIRQILRRLRKARAPTLRLVSLLLKALEAKP